MNCVFEMYGLYLINHVRAFVGRARLIKRGKNMRRIATTLASILAAAVTISLSSELCAGLIVYDSFTGAAGTDISSRNADTINGGSATWRVNSNAILTGNGTVSVPSASKALNIASQASISLPGSNDLFNGNGVLSMKIKASMPNTNSWVSVGFSTDDNPWNWDYSSSMVLKAVVYSSGYYQVLGANGAGTSGSIANFDSAAAHTITLTRDYNWNVSLVVDGNTVTSNWFGNKITPGTVTRGVGYRLNPGDNGVGDGNVDYFAAGTGDYEIPAPAPVPEPASLGVLSLGLLLIRGRSRR